MESWIYVAMLLFVISVTSLVICMLNFFNMPDDPVPFEDSLQTQDVITFGSGKIVNSGVLWNREDSTRTGLLQKPTDDRFNLVKGIEDDIPENLTLAGLNVSSLYGSSVRCTELSPDRPDTTPEELTSKTVNFQAGSNLETWLRFRRGGNPVARSGTVHSSFDTSHFLTVGAHNVLDILFSDTDVTENPLTTVGATRVSRLTNTGDLTIGGDLTWNNGTKSLWSSPPVTRENTTTTGINSLIVGDGTITSFMAARTITIDSIELANASDAVDGDTIDIVVKVDAVDVYTASIDAPAINTTSLTALDEDDQFTITAGEAYQVWTKISAGGPAGLWSRVVLHGSY